jgi:hypothetical protein
MDETWIDLADFWPEFGAVGTIVLAAVFATTRVVRRLRADANTDTADRQTSGLTKLVSRVLTLHDEIYDRIAGVHPHRRPWHSQWLSVKDLYSDLGRVLPALRGQFLDVGCRTKPYASWMKSVDRHVGLDVVAGSAVDYMIEPGKPWPLETGAYQSALCSQVLQVVQEPAQLLAELDRVLTVGGLAVISAPFCYNDMSHPLSNGGTNKDYWRFSQHGLAQLLSPRFEIVEIKTQGGLGSTIGVKFLNWISITMRRRIGTNLVFAAMLPVWVPFCLLVNAAGWCVDRIDTTGLCYHNVFAVVRKREIAPRS